MYSMPTNVYDISTGNPLADQETTAEDIQLWSAVTLGSLQKQLAGHEDDPRFADVRELVDELARQFSTADPIDIADYFQAIQALASVQNESYSRLDELEAYEPAA